MLRTPSAIEGEGGAISEDDARAKGRMVQVRDQVAQLAFENGLRVPDGVASSLLPTPAASQFNDSEDVSTWLNRREQVKLTLNNGNGFGTPLNIAVRLLPTPQTMDGLPARSPEKIAESKERTPAGYSNLRESVVNDLLPTPMTSEARQTNSPGGWNRNSPPLGTMVHATDWGKFQPAIERWEQVIGREAPAPTKPDGKDGAHRLSSKLTEWMMGLPDGWITSVGLTRNEELKACSNGVVPQQAALALSILLNKPVERERERSDEASHTNGV